ncbi:MAG: hypothetical protein BWY48_00494 [Parcubacteria group bacterium ADurb.Bin305]|nr:MAG: hypothetical protein BWY48_00494 [Parcubacteria group bacterium ADurb.Bin305]
MKKLTKEKEFNKKFCGRYSGVNCCQFNNKTIPYELYNWHISEMIKMLDRVKKKLIFPKSVIINSEGITKLILGTIYSGQLKRLNELKQTLK